MLAQVIIITSKANNVANVVDVNTAALVRKCQRFGGLRKRRMIMKTRVSKIKIDGSHIIVPHWSNLGMLRLRRNSLCPSRAHVQVLNKIPSNWVNENLLLPKIVLSPNLTKFCCDESTRCFIVSKLNPATVFHLIVSSIRDILKLFTSPMHFSYLNLPNFSFGPSAGTVRNLICITSDNVTCEALSVLLHWPVNVPLKRNKTILSCQNRVRHDGSLLNMKNCINQ